MVDITEIVRDFGADPDSFRLLDEDGPDLLPYATLVASRRRQDGPLAKVAAVYEWQGAPLMFLVNVDDLDGDADLQKIRRLLAMRGDAPYVGVVSPGRLDVFRVALDRKRLSEARVKNEGAIADRATTFARLANARPKAAVSRHNWISNVVLSLLTGSITKLVSLSGIGDDDGISLVGRALFTRFLADRGLLPPAMIEIHSGATLFDNRVVAKQTSEWLDKTFNGDLLPLSEGIWEILPDQAYQVLGDILRRAPDGQLYLGWQEKWDHLDFAHIPVGVLSQAYELHLRRHAPLQQRREGGYYTPRPIADLLVRASLKAHGRNGFAHNARILDPAAGAGVFLLTAFRELVAETWRYEGVRPRTTKLREILYDQISGFDINEAALRFAALGLYLLSIELDPEPRPVNKLRFKNLRGRVLHMVGSRDEKEGAVLGSLGPAVSDEHNGQYDVVIGNPPWASGTGLADWDLVQSKIGAIAREREISIAAPPLPNEGLDLPFVWRAMEWAKPGGQIAFALHARLLFQQGDGMPDARQALFEALDVTSVINGVDLRQTKVWPEISAPFCLLLATNRKPGATAGFRLISPKLEETLNDAGSMRVDALNAEIIAAHSFSRTPEILKILYRGTRADLGLVERIRAKGFPTLEAFWREAIGSERGHLLGSGNGYQKLRKSSRIRKNGDRRPGVDARYLNGLPELASGALSSVLIETDGLARFNDERIHDPRSSDIFQGPIAIVHQSPPSISGRIGVAVSDKPVVFNESFYGYSPGSLEGSDQFVRYLAIVFGSKLATWIALVTSGKFGFEREVIEKSTLDRIPIPDFRSLSPHQKSEVMDLFKDLSHGNASWEEADNWVARLYGLGRQDLQVISDTLRYGLPFSENKRLAQSKPVHEEQSEFCDWLSEELSPWCERYKSQIVVLPIRLPKASPWLALEIRVSADTQRRTPDGELGGLLAAADRLAATEMIVHVGSYGLLICRLAQMRYWSATQARLLAQRIIWEHSDVLKGKSRA
ncbi:HsdM family class I SAM-dependent methyltransferase [Affinirhizobium pseudoryzae]|uniref:HsdM family class I SAM-dependent methyltransferase n=1 Tax=Allorhizobium pseudoryzae TaxID=379684 RepID=UPI0013EDB111|nr:N-6 DNA methylase [Allorhizobium pseudoryzae]